MSVVLQRNKQVVRAFLEQVFNEHDVDGAIARYVGTHYRQHNPQVGDGVHGFATFFHGFFKQYPHSSLQIKRMIAEEDQVAVHLHWKSAKDVAGDAVMDFFRLENGRIVEHWDVIQAVPAVSANNNSMF